MTLFSVHSISQVAINTDASKPHVSAMLDIKSTSHGLLIPRMTLAQRNAIASPATGLLIYQTDVSAGYYYNSGLPATPSWVKLGQFILPYEDSASAAPYTHVFKISTSWAHYAPAIYGITKSQEGVAIVGENSSAASSGIGVKGTTNTEGGLGVVGYSTHSSGTGWGVLGSTNGGTGGGVEGYSGSDTGLTYGVKGSTHSAKGYGVHGTGHTYGVYGKSYEAKGRATSGISTGTESIGVHGEAKAENSTGVWGEGTKQGVYGISALSTGKGIFGVASAATGENYGVYGETGSNSGNGVYGIGPFNGVKGVAASVTLAGHGVWGTTNSANGQGVLGYAALGTGVEGQTAASGKPGVYGLATSGTGENFGVKGQSNSSSGTGVFGFSPKYGVYGISTAGTGRAVVGEAGSTGSIGVYGKALEANSTGVWGEGSLYDFYAAGPGTNYGSASSVRWKTNILPIDKPLDMINALRGVYFDWNAANGGKHDVGMIAEEVGKVLPEIVVYEANGTDASGMDYSKLTPLLVEGLKALKAENDLLKARLEKLEKLLDTGTRQ